MTLNRAALTEAVSRAAQLTHTQSMAAVDAVEQALIDAVASGTPVRLNGLLSIDVVERAERTGRNPRTGDAIVIAATRVPKVTAGRVLKEAAKRP